MIFSAFSGGNQQKALMAKWLQTRPDLLCLHEPTQGVDVGARTQLIRLVREAAARGTAVVLASSDFEQLALCCDRVAVFAGGTIVSELSAQDITEDGLARASYASA
jgi:ribose transport system ATP-binding protein